MKYRVWHNCQIGVVKNFYVDVKNNRICVEIYKG